MSARGRRTAEWLHERRLCSHSHASLPAVPARGAPCTQRKRALLYPLPPPLTRHHLVHQALHAHSLPSPQAPTHPCVPLPPSCDLSPDTTLSTRLSTFWAKSFTFFSTPGGRMRTRAPMCFLMRSATWGWVGGQGQGQGPGGGPMDRPDAQQQRFQRAPPPHTHH